EVAQGHAAKHAGQSWPWAALQRAYRRRRPDRLRARLPARPRRHRLQAQGLKLSLRPLARLAEDEEPGPFPLWTNCGEACRAEHPLVAAAHALGFVHLRQKNLAFEAPRHQNLLI